MDAHKTSVAGSLATTFSEKLKVTSAKMGGDQKELNVAIIKATTSQFHVAPKEKHVRTLKLAVHPSAARRSVGHIISELHHRLQESTDWLTALKTLITLHRLMRESDRAFMEELARYNAALAVSHGRTMATGAPAAVAAPARLFCTDNFIDKTTSEGRFDFSEWVRAYGKYLDEQVTVYSTLKWYVEQEAPGQESYTRSLGARDLLLQLPTLQRLERRLLDCVPRGAATQDPVVLFSLSLVVKESFKLYKAVSEGIINLADAFFEMDYHDATRGLEFYRESIAASDALSGYFATVEQIDEIKRTMQLPKLSAPPSDFLASMEAYVAEAPRQLAPDGTAPVASKRGAPLRKGKLLQQSSSGRYTAYSGPTPVAAPGPPRDPGMVLPLPSASSGPAGSHSADSGGAAAVDSMPPGPSAPPDLLGDTAEGGGAGGEPASAAEAPPAPKPAPSALDLLSDLDFSFPATAGAQPASLAAAAPLSSNPFADAPLAPPAPPLAQQLVPSSSNPFGDPMPAPAPASGFGSAGFEWALASPAAPPAPQQPAWGAFPGPQVQQPQYGGGYGGALPSPAGGTAHHPAVHSDDPFASFGAPSPAAAAPRPAGGAFWAPAPAPPAPAAYGTAPSPPRPIIGDELSKAALHDPFAALTGLPPKGSPGTAGNKPSPPRAGMYPPPPGGFF